MIEDPNNVDNANPNNSNPTVSGDFNPAPTAPATPGSAPVMDVNQPVQGYMSPFAFSKVLDVMNDKIKFTNDLGKQRNSIINTLYGDGINEADLATLPPEVQSLIQGGDRKAMELQLRLINDQVKGRTNGLAQSLDFLTNTYSKTLDQLQQQQQQSMSTIMGFVDRYGSKAKDAIKSILGEDAVKNLEAQGFNIDNFASIQTLDEQKQNAALAGAGGGTMPPKAPTTSESDDFGFFQRMLNGMNNMNKVEETISSLPVKRQWLLNQESGLSNILKTKEERAYNQSQREFTEARLRKESGAAIPPEEFANDRRTYFPQPGDDKDTLAQKKAARENMLKSFAISSRNAFWEYYGHNPYQATKATDFNDIIGYSSSPTQTNTDTGEAQKSTYTSASGKTFNLPY